MELQPIYGTSQGNYENIYVALDTDQKFGSGAGYHHHHDDANDLDDDGHDHENKDDHHDDGAQYLANANYKKELDTGIIICDNISK